MKQQKKEIDFPKEKMHSAPPADEDDDDEEVTTEDSTPPPAPPSLSRGNHHNHQAVVDAILTDDEKEEGNNTTIPTTGAPPPPTTPTLERQSHYRPPGAFAIMGQRGGRRINIMRRNGQREQQQEQEDVRNDVDAQMIPSSPEIMGQRRSSPTKPRNRQRTYSGNTIATGTSTLFGGEDEYDHHHHDDNYVDPEQQHHHVVPVAELVVATSDSMVSSISGSYRGSSRSCYDIEIAQEVYCGSLVVGVDPRTTVAAGLDANHNDHDTTTNHSMTSSNVPHSYSRVKKIVGLIGIQFILTLMVMGIIALIVEKPHHAPAAPVVAVGSNNNTNSTATKTSPPLPVLLSPPPLLDDDNDNTNNNNNNEDDENDQIAAWLCRDKSSLLNKLGLCTLLDRMKDWTNGDDEDEDEDESTTGGGGEFANDTTTTTTLPIKQGDDFCNTTTSVFATTMIGQCLCASDDQREVQNNRYVIALELCFDEKQQSFDQTEMGSCICHGLQENTNVATMVNQSALVGDLCSGEKPFVQTLIGTYVCQKVSTAAAADLDSTVLEPTLCDAESDFAKSDLGQWICQSSNNDNTTASTTNDEETTTTNETSTTTSTTRSSSTPIISWLKSKFGN